MVSNFAPEIAECEANTDIAAIISAVGEPPCVTHTFFFFPHPKSGNFKNDLKIYERFPSENDLCRAMEPDCLGTLSSTLCKISALKEASE